MKKIYLLIIMCWCLVAQIGAMTELKNINNPSDQQSMISTYDANQNLFEAQIGNKYLIIRCATCSSTRSLPCPLSDIVGFSFIANAKNLVIATATGDIFFYYIEINKECSWSMKIFHMFTLKTKTLLPKKPLKNTFFEIIAEYIARGTIKQGTLLPQNNKTFLDLFPLMEWQGEVALEGVKLADCKKDKLIDLIFGDENAPKWDLVNTPLKIQ